MKIRVYPDNGYGSTSAWSELEFDAVPRVGDFVAIPYETEQDWARKVLKYDIDIEKFSQWVQETKMVLDFEDAMCVTNVRWGYDYNLQKMVCFMSLDSPCEEYRHRDKDIPELTNASFDTIRKNTILLYELNE